MESQTIELGADTLKALAAIANPGMLPGDWIALGVGLVQCALIGYGLRLMSKSNDERAEQTRAIREENQAQHEENMARLKAQHEESMAALKTLVQEGQQQHEESMTALKVLIERTARP